jgi:hypothetical protein
MTVLMHTRDTPDLGIESIQVILRNNVTSVSSDKTPVSLFVIVNSDRTTRMKKSICSPMILPKASGKTVTHRRLAGGAS